MNQRVLFRIAIILFVVAGSVFAIQFIRGLGNDIDLLPGESVGMIAALELNSDGAQAVVLDVNGKVTEIPEYISGKTDREPVWRPDGQRLFFSSDRVGNTFQIFRWRPGAEKVDRRSVGTRPKGTPWFGPAGYPDVNSSALMISSANVIDYTPKDGNTYQILPPPSGQAAQSSGDDQGVTSNLDAVYSRLGKSFRKAKYGPNRENVIAIMRREDGETLFSQLMVRQDGKEGLPSPVVIVSGRQLDFDVLANGQVLVSVIGLSLGDQEEAPPEFIKNGKLVLPYENAMFLYDPAKPTEQPKFLFVSKEAKTALINPVVAPNGEAILITEAEIDENGIATPKTLQMLTLPLGETTRSILISTGKTYEPTFSPQNDRILYAKSQDGFRGIFVNDYSGTSEKLVSPKGKNFSNPAMSPQVAK